MRPNILVCSWPKSGSSHIKLSLQRLLGYRPAYAVSDNVLNTPSAQIVFGLDGQILHHHIEATPCNVTILKRYEDEVRVVVTLRNVLDSIVSTKEYLSQPRVKVRGFGLGQLPPNDWDDLSDEVRLRWATYNSTPWYFSFFVLWNSAAVRKLFVRYDDFFNDQVAGIRRILEYVGIEEEEYSDQQILKAIDVHPDDGKFNVGRSGRGRELLSQKLIDVVYEHADSWGPYWGKRIREELIDG